MTLMLSAGIFAQTVINVNPHTDPNGTNYAKIKKVTLYRPDNGQTIVQTSEKSGVVGANDQYPVHIVGVEAYTPGSNQGSVITLDYFNFEGVEIRNMNLNSSNSGVGVYENGVTYPANSNFSAFEQKLEEYLLDANMRSMFYYDGTTNLPCNTLPPSCTTQDFDIQFAYAFESTDYLLASEKYGNSQFTVIALDANGNAIGDFICYGCGGGSTYQKWDWNTGYAYAPYNTTQAQTLTVIPISLFNAGQPVYGLRIFNGVGEADVKFFGLSDNTFTNNPINPTVTGLRGNVFDDLDALTDNTVDGNGIHETDGSPLYVHLVQGGTVVDTRPVADDGSYIFVDLNAGSYEVQLSTNTATVGQAPPAIVLPGNWSNTGEHVGAGSGDDGNPNGKLTVNVSSGSITENANFGIKEIVVGACDVLGTNGGGFTTTITDVVQNCNSTYTITVRVEHNGCSGPSCKDLSHFSVEAAPGTYSNVSVNVVSGNLNYNYENGPNLGSDPFDGFKLDNTSGIGNGNAGVFEITYTLTSLQNQQFSAKAGNNGQITSFTIAQFQSVMNCNGTTCSTPTGSLNGTVFIDSDQLADSQVDGVGVGAPDGTQLYANLINGSNQVVANTAVAANGTYSFSNVAAGSYSVVLSTTASTTAPSLPVNWINVGENASAAGIQNPADGRINSLTVTGGGTTANVDFGILKNVGSLSGTLYNDEDALTDSQVDGTPIQQPGGTQMYAILINGSNQVQAAQAIAANGTYSFADVPAGSYSILISTTNNATSPSKPTNWQYTGENASTAGVDGNADGRINNVTVTAGSSQTNFDFGIRENLGALSGNVYNDTDGDSDVDGTAIYQPAGSQLYATLLNSGNSVVSSTAVGNDGSYSFTGLPAGNYSVVISTSQNATSATLPANWIHTGENVGTTGNDGHANGVVAASVTAGNTTSNVNFGIAALAAISGNVYNDINGLSDGIVNGSGIDDVNGNVLYVNLVNGSNQVVASMAVNPDGTYAFSGVQPGTYSVQLSSSLGTIGNAVPALNLPADWSTVGENIGAGAGSDGNPNGILTNITPTYGSNIQQVNFGLQQSATGLSGNVFNDVNGLTDNTVNGTGITAAGASPLFVNVLDGSSLVVASQAVNPDGSYYFTALTPGTFKVWLSSSLGTVGQAAPALNLPANWMSTGENVGNGAGNDGTADSKLNSVAVVLGAITTEVNFGLVDNVTAISGNVFHDEDALTDGAVDGTGVNNVGGADIYVNLVNAANKVVLSSLVNPDGTYSFSGIDAGTYTVVLNSTLGTTGQTVPALSLPGSWVNSGENIGATPPGNDGTADGRIVATAVFGATTTEVNFGLYEVPTGLSGNVFNDANGLTNNLVDGNGIQQASAEQLYVNILNASNVVVGTATVAADGSWTAIGIVPGSYSAVVSTVLGTVGQAAPAATLPAQWVNTGERVGVGNGHDGTVDGRLNNVAVVSGSVTTDVNFGIEERPIANTDTEAPQGNPGGTNKVLVAPTLFTASDNDGSVTAIRLTTFPKNITTITINMVVYDAGTWPVNGVSIPTNANGHPTQAIEIDPIDGSISAIINFVAVDNAGFESLLPGSVTLPFTVTAGRIVNNYPAVGYNSVSYEDLWPGTGDYDFNDLVVSYSFRVVANASNSVDTMEATFILRAVGAAYKNGFGFQFGGNVVDPADIVSATGSQLTVGYVSVAANGLEAGQSKPTFILYENSFDLMPHPGGGGIGVNTDLQNPYVTPDTLVATFVFAPGKYTIFDLDLANFNPFLIVNGVRGREIHLPYYEPTDLADPSFFNTASDDSNPANGRYYVTPNNLPWAINISGYYEYPQEKVNILNTHLKFREWAESGGQLFADWFLDRPGYRAENNIYPEPNNDNGGVVNPGGIGKQEIKNLEKGNIQLNETVK